MIELLKTRNFSTKSEQRSAEKMSRKTLGISTKMQMYFKNQIFLISFKMTWKNNFIYSPLKSE